MILAWFAKLGVPSWLLKALALVGATLAAVFYLLAKGETIGKAKIQAKTQAAVAKAQGQAQDVQAQVEEQPQGQAAKQLEDKWTQK